MKNVTKPWGEYTDYFRSNECDFKVLLIKDGHSISYQKHERRGEFWYVMEGNPVLKISFSEEPTQEFSQSVMPKGETVEIISECWHQLIAPIGGGDVVIAEMQYGECSEDDITRLDDQYNRN